MILKSVNEKNEATEGKREQKPEGLSGKEVRVS